MNKEQFKRNYTCLIGHSPIGAKFSTILVICVVDNLLDRVMCPSIKLFLIKKYVDDIIVTLELQFTIENKVEECSVPLLDMNPILQVDNSNNLENNKNIENNNNNIIIENNNHSQIITFFTSLSYLTEFTPKLSRIFPSL